MNKKNNRIPTIINSEININVSVAFLIIELRKERGMTGNELAKIMNVSQQQISRYERINTKLTLEKTERFAAAFDMNIWQFMYKAYLYQHLDQIYDENINKIEILEEKISNHFKN